MSDQALQPMTAVRPILPSSLEVTWQSGTTMTVDLAAVIRSLPMLAPLEDPETFAAVSLGPERFDVVWPGGLDFAGDQLWRWGLEQAGELMPPDEFRSWQSRHGLSLTGAAKTLGLSRRMVQYYATGAKPIPKIVRLACMGAELELRGRPAGRNKAAAHRGGSSVRR